MKNYNINTLLDKHNISAYYNLYCPIALQAQTLTSWKDYYFPDFVEHKTSDSNNYTRKNLGFRDSLLVDTNNYSETDDTTGKTTTWESGTRFINNYRPSNSADNLKNSARLIDENYLILPPSSNYFYVPGYFERNGETKYLFTYYFDNNSEVAKYGYKWSSLTDGGIPRFSGWDLTNQLHQNFAIYGAELPYFFKQDETIKARPAPQRFPKPLEELVVVENNQLETIAVDSLIDNYDDPQKDLARYDYKLSYDDGSKGYISKAYVDKWSLLLV